MKYFKFTGTESRMGSCQGMGKGRMGVAFNVYRVSILQDGKGSGDCLHNNVNIFNSTELYT